MNHYHHITLNERESIMLLWHDGQSITEISRILARNKSTISRELHRNSSEEEYSAVRADTPDRGSEFSKHAEITKVMEIEFYFPYPHHPW